MNYKYKRNKAKLSVHFVAKSLGIEDKVYREVESGERALSGFCLDVFMELVGNNRSVYRNQQYAEERNAVDWYESKSAEELNELKKKFNVQLKDIADAVDLHPSTLSRILNKKVITQQAYQIHLIYDYFNNSINMRYEKENNKKVMVNREIDWNKLLELIGMSLEELSNAIGKKTCNVRRWLKGIYHPSKESLKRIDSIIKDVSNNKYNISNVYVGSEPVVIEDCGRTYTTEENRYIEEDVKSCTEIDKDWEITRLKEEIEELKTQLKRYEKLIDMLP